jgi:hypothetical protein
MIAQNPAHPTPYDAPFQVDRLPSAAGNSTPVVSFTTQRISW